jgi:hypothetical protein
VLEMRWHDVDLEHGIWTLGAVDTKQRKAQSTPLNVAGAQISPADTLQRRAIKVPATQVTGPGQPKELGPMSEAACATRGASAPELKDMRIHDAALPTLRDSAQAAVRQKALGHQTPAMASVHPELIQWPLPQGMSSAITTARCSRRRLCAS